MLFKNDQLNNSSLKLLIQFKGMERIRLIGDQTNVAAVSAMESRSTLFCIGLACETLCHFEPSLLLSSVS